MFPLPDGIYNVLVIEARDGPDGDGVRVELALTDGPRKGEVVQLRATKLDRDPVLMLGLPGRLVVREGTPSFTLD